MKKRLSRLADYCRDRKIVYLFVGSSDEGTLFFNVREIASPRKRAFFERLLKEDNEGHLTDIQYIKRGITLSAAK